MNFTGQFMTVIAAALFFAVPARLEAQNSSEAAACAANLNSECLTEFAFCLSAAGIPIGRNGYLYLALMGQLDRAHQGYLDNATTAFGPARGQEMANGTFRPIRMYFFMLDGATVPEALAFYPDATGRDLAEVGYRLLGLRDPINSTLRFAGRENIAPERLRFVQDIADTLVAQAEEEGRAIDLYEAQTTVAVASNFYTFLGDREGLVEVLSLVERRGIPYFRIASMPDELVALLGGDAVELLGGIRSLDTEQWLIAAQTARDPARVREHIARGHRAMQDQPVLGSRLLLDLTSVSVSQGFDDLSSWLVAELLVAAEDETNPWSSHNALLAALALHAIGAQAAQVRSYLELAEARVPEDDNFFVRLMSGRIADAWLEIGEPERAFESISQSHQPAGSWTTLDWELVPLDRLDEALALAEAAMSDLAFAELRRDIVRALSTRELEPSRRDWVLQLTTELLEAPARSEWTRSYALIAYAMHRLGDAGLQERALRRASEIAVAERRPEEILVIALAWHNFEHG